jgi:microcystin-dependent protein
MPRNGSGTASLAEAPFTPGTTISSSAVNADFSDIIAMLTDSVAADGQTTMTGQLLGYPGSAAAPTYTFGSSPTNGFYLSGTNQIGLAIAGALVGFFNANGFNTTAGQPTGTPVGAIQDFAGSSAPAGWYLCYGQAVSRTTYATLFGIIGTTYGSGDGLTTFNLPDCRGRATYGVDNMGGTAANRITVAGGNFNATVLGGSGGNQNVTLLSGNLPATSLTFTGTPVQPTFTGAAIPPPSLALATGFGQVLIANGGGVQNFVINTLATASYTPSGTVGTITPAGNISTFGGSAGFSILSPAITFNKIIFAGA